MNNSSILKECFGDQGGSILCGEVPKDCLNCDSEIFERCHKVTIAASLQGINMDFSLVVVVLFNQPECVHLKIR